MTTPRKKKGNFQKRFQKETCTRTFVKLLGWQMKIENKLNIRGEGNLILKCGVVTEISYR